MVNALKSILSIEVPFAKNKELLNAFNVYVKQELGIFDNPDDDSLCIIIVPSDRYNIQLLNSPYDCWERYEDTLAERFSNIEEFIKTYIN